MAVPLTRYFSEGEVQTAIDLDEGGVKALMALLYKKNRLSLYFVKNHMKTILLFSVSYNK